MSRYRLTCARIVSWLSGPHLLSCTINSGSGICGGSICGGSFDNGSSICGISFDSRSSLDNRWLLRLRLTRPLLGSCCRGGSGRY